VEGKKVTGPHEELTYRVIGAAMAVHRRLGPGHREAIYRRALEEELASAGIPFEAEKSLPVCDGERLLGYYIPDIMVDDKVNI
jgi:GxxExxY protein